MFIWLYNAGTEARYKSNYKTGHSRVCSCAGFVLWSYLISPEAQRDLLYYISHAAGAEACICLLALCCSNSRTGNHHEPHLPIQVSYCILLSAILCKCRLPFVSVGRLVQVTATVCKCRPCVSVGNLVYMSATLCKCRQSCGNVDHLV